MSKNTNKRTKVKAKTKEELIFYIVWGVLACIAVTRCYMWGLNWVAETTGYWDVQPIDFQRNLVMGILLFYMVEIKSFILWLWK